jgi:hypothetical protein
MKLLKLIRKVENKLGCQSSCPSIVVAKEYRKQSCINGINTNTVSLLRCVHECLSFCVHM